MAESTGQIILITGVMAAGKSSVAQAVAKHLHPSIHLRGDVFRRMIVNGGVDMSGTPNTQALAQLLLRYKAAAAAAKVYAQAGFNVIYQDVIIGPLLEDVADLYAGERLSIFVLCPNAAVVAEREALRSKKGYSLVTVQALQAAMATTPDIGLWIDSSEQSVEETAEAVLATL